MSVKGKRLLIVDDEPNIRRILQVAFEKAGYKPLVAEDAARALALLAEGGADAVLSDVTMPGMSGVDLLREIKDRWPQTPVVVMTAYGTIPQATQAIRDGAWEYVTKPFDLEHLKRVVAAAMESEPVAKASTRGGKAAARPFLADSPSMREILETVEQVADSRATVLIGGESGVGKEVVARALHTMSVRVKKPFVAVSCAALPETLLESELFGHEKGAFTGAQGSKAGRFELAHEGTLFLDEIGEVPMGIQVKLLRVLQEREFERLGAGKPTRVDVRLVAATNRELREAVEEGLFRLDLLYRLQVVELVIPPLRERHEDILPLANHILERLEEDNRRQPQEVAPAAQRWRHNHHRPGNLTQVENAMERATVLAPTSASELTAALLPSPLRRAA